MSYFATLFEAPRLYSESDIVEGGMGTPNPNLTPAVVSGCLCLLCMSPTLTCEVVLNSNRHMAHL